MDKVESLLSDKTKFCVVTEPLHKLLLRLEDKVNRLLTELKRCSIITDKKYDELHVSGSTPGILYGLPKITKPRLFFRPIFKACGTATYTLAKFLVPCFPQSLKTSIPLKNSYKFVDDVKKKPKAIWRYGDGEL